MPPPALRIGKVIARLLLLAGGYFAAGWLGLLLAPPDLKISLIWLPTGIVAAGLYRWGLRYWPGVFLGTTVLVGFSFPVPWPLAGAVVAGQTLAPVLAAWLLRGAVFHPAFDRRRDIALLVAAAVFGMMVSATGGTVTLRLAGLLSPEEFGSAWLRWWLGDVMGVLVAAPILLSIGRSSREGIRFREREFALWGVTGAALVAVIFFLPPVAGVSKLPLVFFPLLLTVWSALRFGATATSLAVMVVATAAAAGLALRRGPFLQPDVIEGVFLLWAYVATMAVLSLMIAGIEVSRRSAERALRASQSELERANAELVAANRRVESASQAKGAFLANMSHELRTPMNGILGMTDLLLTADLSGEAREYAEIVRSSGQTLLRLLNDVLDLSKIEAGKVEMVPVDFDLHALVDEVVRLATAVAAGRIEVRLEILPGVPRYANCDPARLRQVLGNLLDNAIKFTAEGSVRLRLEAISSSALRFAVIDTGDGIPADRLALIFQPFEQADGSVTRRYGGTGLGLTISSRLVELMGGRLEVTSELRRGSTFAFTIAMGKAGGRVEDAPPLPISVGPPDSRRLLVVEDNPINQKVACLQLRQLGYHADVAGDGAQALSRLAEQSYDLILMDCQMPVMDGYAATRAIRAGKVAGLNPAIPIVALTANVMAPDLEACLTAGMDDCLTKPVQLLTLAAALARFLPAQRS